jgi:hypothetical protein
MRVTLLWNSEDAPAWSCVVVGVDEVVDPVTHAVGGGDLVHGPLDVVADRRRRVE